MNQIQNYSVVIGYSVSYLLCPFPFPPYVPSYVPFRPPRCDQFVECPAEESGMGLGAVRVTMALPKISQPGSQDARDCKRCETGYEAGGLWSDSEPAKEGKASELSTEL